MLKNKLTLEKILSFKKFPSIFAIIIINSISFRLLFVLANNNYEVPILWTYNENIALNIKTTLLVITDIPNYINDFKVLVENTLIKIEDDIEEISNLDDGNNDENLTLEVVIVVQDPIVPPWIPPIEVETPEVEIEIIDNYYPDDEVEDEVEDEIDDDYEEVIEDAPDYEIDDNIEDDYPLDQDKPEIDTDIIDEEGLDAVENDDNEYEDEVDNEFLIEEDYIEE